MFTLLCDRGELTHSLTKIPSSRISVVTLSENGYILKEKYENYIMLCLHVYTLSAAYTNTHFHLVANTLKLEVNSF